MIEASIIIPVFNSQDTIKDCLSPLLKLEDRIEILVVNDASTDNTREILKEYEVKCIDLTENSGPSAARNEGIKYACSENLIFIDSDVIISVQDLEKAIDLLKSGHESIAFSAGIPCNKSITGSFHTVYKSLYMEYTFINVSDNPNFIYGSFCGFKSSTGEMWPNHLRIGEDTYLGQLLTEKSYNIHFLKDIRIKHRKAHNLFSILKNDFQVPFHFCKSFIIHKKKEKNDNFSHVSKTQIFSIALIPLILLSIFKIELLFLIIPWLYLNNNFFNFIRSNSTKVHFLKSVPFTFVDQFVMGLGIFFGLLYYKFIYRDI